MKAVVAAFNQEKALVGAFSVITNLRICFGWNFLKHYYRNQWTTSGDKKLVVDASQELRRYRRRHQEPLLFSDQDVATEPGTSAAAELYPEYPEYSEYPGHTDRDTHTQHQVGGAQQGLST